MMGMMRGMFAAILGHGGSLTSQVPSIRRSTPLAPLVSGTSPCTASTSGSVERSIRSSATQP